MDRIDIIGKINEQVGKYKYALLILFAGIVLMIIPAGEITEIPVESQDVQQTQTPAQELEEILGEIDGVGKVKVLLTESSGPQTIYQTDNDTTGSENSERIHTQTVIVNGSDRGEIGLISSIKAPVYLGAIIVCQGGDIANVKLSVVQAVSNVTGISSDRISVLKMK